MRRRTGISAFGVVAALFVLTTPAAGQNSDVLSDRCIEEIERDPTILTCIELPDGSITATRTPVAFDDFEPAFGAPAPSDGGNRGCATWGSTAA